MMAYKDNLIKILKKLGPTYTLEPKIIRLIYCAMELKSLVKIYVQEKGLLYRKKMLALLLLLLLLLSMLARKNINFTTEIVL